MRRILHSIVLGLFVLSARVHCQLPKDFHWVDLKREADTVSRVSRALAADRFSAIREIGLLGDYALVFTTLRQPDAPTPDSDSWKVYNVTIGGGAIKMLLSG